MTARSNERGSVASRSPLGAGPLSLIAVVVLALAGPACGDDEESAGRSGPSGGTGGGGAGSGGGGAGGGSGGAGGGSGGGSSCHATPRDEDAPRTVVVAHPYDAAGNQANTFEALELDSDGTLAATGQAFAMGRAIEGEITFTPDGAVGIAVHDDGTLGVFTVSDGSVTVVHAVWSGAFYAGRVWMSPSGDYALVLDPNWVENGGGIYRVDIACDGTLTDAGLVTASKLARRAEPLDAALGTHVVAAASMFGVPEGDDLHAVRFDDASVHLDGADAFGDDEAIVASLAVTSDRSFALVGDNSAFSGLPNRVAVIAITGADGAAPALSPAQVLSPIEDPVDIVTSPWNDRAIVVSAFGDAIFELAYDAASPNAPFTVLGELAYDGPGPLLPVDAIRIDRGALAGRVLVGENTGVRSIQFEEGAVVDLGAFDFGPGLDNIVGAIGVQP